MRPSVSESRAHAARLSVGSSERSRVATITAIASETRERASAPEAVEAAVGAAPPVATVRAVLGAARACSMCSASIGCKKLLSAAPYSRPCGAPPSRSRAASTRAASTSASARVESTVRALVSRCSRSHAAAVRWHRRLLLLSCSCSLSSTFARCSCSVCRVATAASASALQPCRLGGIDSLEEPIARTAATEDAVTLSTATSVLSTRLASSNSCTWARAACARLATSAAVFDSASSWAARSERASQTPCNQGREGGKTARDLVLPTSRKLFFGKGSASRQNMLQ
eukprot:4790716-Pleurochrysis_carterae.AAC.3